MDEPILAKDETKDEFILFPIKRRDIWEMYKKQSASFWQNEEIDYSQDIIDWNTKLTSDERHFLSHVLAFFASSDTIVLENLATKFSNEVAYPELKAAYSAQQFFETIHSEGYGLIIDTLISNADEKKRLFEAIRTIPCVSKKANWAMKWISSDKSFATRLAAFACVEGILFSASFCAIFFMKTRGLLPGLAFLNALISRDEGLHVALANLVYTKYVKNKLDVATMHELVSEAVDIEIEFVTHALDVQVIGMNSSLMIEYVKYVADYQLTSMGYPKLYNAKMVFDFMQNISISNKSNFFEARVSEYQVASIAGGPKEFTTTADF